MKGLLTGAVLLLVLLTANVAGAINVGLVKAEPAHNAGFVEDYLRATGRFDTIQYIDAATSTPDLSTLYRYDALLVWSNAPWYDSDRLGDHLAQYIDFGGGVVLASFSTRDHVDLSIGGRFGTGGYSPYVNGPGAYTHVSLGFSDRNSPFLFGVNDLQGYYHDVPRLNVAARLLASWTDGTPLIASTSDDRVVGINLYPGELTQTGLGGDYPRLFANALVLAAGPQGPDPFSATSVPVANGWWLFPALVSGAVLMWRRKV